jgi:hypothetical protein
MVWRDTVLYGEARLVEVWQVWRVPVGSGMVGWGKARKTTNEAFVALVRCHKKE